MPAEYIEIVSSKGNGGQHFVVNTAVPSVQPVTHGSFEVDNATAKSLFQPGDNLLIIGAGFVLPESFCLSSNGFGAGIFPLPKINLYFFTEPQHWKYYPSIAGGDGTFFVPFENFEYIINSYINVASGTFKTDQAPPNDVATKIPMKFAPYLSVEPATVNISMINVPASLNGTTQRITPFLKVKHNLPMTD